MHHLNKLSLNYKFRNYMVPFGCANFSSNLLCTAKPLINKISSLEEEIINLKSKLLKEENKRYDAETKLEHALNYYKLGLD